MAGNCGLLPETNRLRGLPPAAGNCQRFQFPARKPEYTRWLPSSFQAIPLPTFDLTNYSLKVSLSTFPPEMPQV